LLAARSLSKVKKEERRAARGAPALSAGYFR
jgi:hypothetical protein